MSNRQGQIDPHRRAVLAEKGQRLYRKSCGAGDDAACAEGFVLYHLRRGETIIARDMLTFLEERLQVLETTDPEGRLPMTRALADRIRRHLEKPQRHS